MSDYFTINTYDKEHLLMCEKEDLVEYIECLRVDVKLQHQENEEVWEQCAKVTAEKLNLLTENKKLKEQRKPLTRSDTRIKQLEEDLDRKQEEKDKVWEQWGKVTSKKLKLHAENEKLKKQVSSLQDHIIKKIENQYGEQLEALEKENEKLKKWSLSDDMIESTSAESIEEFERDVRDNWKELVENNELNEEFNKELMDNYIDEVQKLKEFINQQKVTVVKLDQHGQELSK